ncbi:phosphatases II [Thermothelomyces heterothallicus CBS 203.75]
MLTAESEGGQLKCHPYWKGNDFGPMRLRALSEKKVSLDLDKRRPSTTTNVDSGTQTTNQFTFPPQAPAINERPYVIIRKFALSHAAHPFSPIREVTQLHYPSWPDFGAPAQPSHLLALVELANMMQRSAPPLDREGSETLLLNWHDGPDPREHARPMLVHCSAGCGRTGAFCTVDSVIDMLKRQRQHVLAQSKNGTGCSAQSSTPNCDLSGHVSMGGAANSDRLTADQSRPPEQSYDIDTSWLDDDSLDLIAQTVEDFRGQRLSMVQSLRQFVLCYETVLEWIRRIQEHGGGGTDAKGRERSGSLGY